MDLGSVSGRSLYFFWSFNLSRRAYVYIDGNNMLESLAGMQVDGHHFDYRKFLTDLMGPNQEIKKINYYGAVFPQDINREKFKADERFYSFLRGQTQEVEVKLGRFKHNDGVVVEKGVDVQLATDLIFDAFYQCYDDAYVCSADSDLVPAVRQVRKYFKSVKVFAIAPHGKGIIQSSYDGVVKIFPNIAKKYWVRRNVDPDSAKALEAKFAKKP